MSPSGVLLRVWQKEFKEYFFPLLLTCWCILYVDNIVEVFSTLLFDLVDICIDSLLPIYRSLEIWFVGVADFKLSLNIPAVSWSQGDGESLLSTRSLAAPLLLVFFSIVLNPCCIGPGTMSIVLGILSDRTGLEHFLQICEAHVLNSGFECWHKSWIQFISHSAINSAKWIFFKIHNSEMLLSWKGCHTQPGDIRVNTRPLANEAVSLYNLIWLDWKRINPRWHTWTPETVTCLPRL